MCKITDLGLGSIKASPTENKWQSFVYKSPEALDKKAVTIASDVYSFGLIALELFNNQKAFNLPGKKKKNQIFEYNLNILIMIAPILFF